ncbi:hypothetical protein NEHOM01_1951 [Nematocida homosporus]|uniref:uncharacterized protein n=1 Tax=Nematocida homosporus TaxID=1912981 RepID=UPI002220FD74|nr:uncharacterized protein NEHOM01_1951 [Nematocida homosporus]KAI5187125.1 hypothetical protein NEHOM01_1951 [Nematocida homosporus]
MQDFQKKRGRKPKDGEKSEKIESVRYKCPYTKCLLEYHSSLGYKRHLMYYKHSLFTPSDKKILCGAANCRESDNLKDHIYRVHSEDAAELLEAHDIMTRTAEETEESLTPQMDHDIVHDEGLLDISRAIEEPGAIRDILLHTFPLGVTHITDPEAFVESQVFFCRIPGCGRQFKSLMAYKYHCGKFTHLFKAIVDAYNESHPPLEYSEVRGLFRKKFNLESRFLLEGVSHHLAKMPDQHYNFIFTFDDTQTGHEKRRVKRRASDLAEFALPAEEDPEEAPKRPALEETDPAHIESIVLNGRRLPNVPVSVQGRLSFRALPHEIVFMAPLSATTYLIGAKSGESEATSPGVFQFTSVGNGQLYVLGEASNILNEVCIENHGFPRAAAVLSPGEVLVLFSDGSLQKLLFDKTYKHCQLPDPARETKEFFETFTNIIDFTILGQDLILCTATGDLINCTTEKERHFSAPLVCVSSTSEAVLAVDTNGRTYCVSRTFADLCNIPSKVGTNTVAGLGVAHDLVFISNSLYGLGRIYSISANRTLLAAPQASSHALLVRAGFVVAAGLDGTLYVCGYESDPKVYMKVIKAEMRAEDIYITTSEEEHALIENAPPTPAQDHRTCIQGIIAQGSALVVAFACGVVIRVTDFFREPPRVLGLSAS